MAITSIHEALDCIQFPNYFAAKIRQDFGRTCSNSIFMLRSTIVRLLMTYSQINKEDPPRTSDEPFNAENSIFLRYFIANLYVDFKSLPHNDLLDDKAAHLYNFVHPDGFHDFQAIILFLNGLMASYEEIFFLKPREEEECASQQIEYNSPTRFPKSSKKPKSKRYLPNQEVKITKIIRRTVPLSRYNLRSKNATTTKIKHVLKRIFYTNKPIKKIKALTETPELDRTIEFVDLESEEEGENVNSIEYYKGVPINYNKPVTKVNVERFLYN